jgi:hypothetical protein
MHFAPGEEPWSGRVWGALLLTVIIKPGQQFVCVAAEIASLQDCPTAANCYALLL